MTTIPLSRVTQIPEFCGPAVLEILFSQYNIHVDQLAIARAGNALYHMETIGMRIDQLALAVRTLAPNLRVWAKRDATFNDIHILINKYKLAVGVEWMGYWEKEIVSEEDIGLALASDPGHYSAVVAIDIKKKKLTLCDPSMYYLNDRVFSFDIFEKMWFDTNIVGSDAPTEAKEWMDDYHVVFVVAPKTTQFSEELGLQKVRVPQEISAAPDQKIPSTL